MSNSITEEVKEELDEEVISPSTPSEEKEHTKSYDRQLAKKVYDSTKLVIISID